MKPLERNQPLARRRILRWSLLVPASLALAACDRLTSRALPAPTATPVAAAIQATAITNAPAAAAAPTQAVALAPTPACPSNAAATPAQTEGPYFKPNSPERVSLLEANYKGTKLVVTGQVLTKSCKPVAKALLDFWQADDGGNYDNSGFKWRGHQFTDANGAFRLETVVPGLYPGRTRHIHVKAQAPNQPALTTQLYFPNEPQNKNDGIFMTETVMAVQATADGKAAQFNFVLNLA